MRPHEKDIVLASADQVAIDAISAKMQGFNPMDLPFIRIAHEKGLGVGEPKDIEIVGYDVSLEDWKFVKEDTFASKGQHLIYHGPLKRYEKQLLQSPLAVGAISPPTSITMSTGTPSWDGSGSRTRCTRSGDGCSRATATGEWSSRDRSRSRPRSPPGVRPGYRRR